LLDTNGTPVPFKGDSASALFHSQEQTFGDGAGVKPGWLSKRISQWMPSLEGHFPDAISDRAYPRIQNAIPNAFEFYSNGPPHLIAQFSFNKVYSIEAEGDYQLTVRPVVYQYGSKPGILERVDLPSVTTMVHLLPPAKP
jgi:hypothetical protein